MEDSMQDDVPERTGIQRRRTAYACVSCRARKSRCDGHNPCGMCQKLGIDCHYDHSVGSTKGKSDLILNAILKMEASIYNIDQKVSGLQHHVSSLTTRQSASYASPDFANTTPGPSTASGTRNLSASANNKPIDQIHGNHSAHDFNNATISSDHTSTTEAILHWPVFDTFQDLRRDGVLKSGAIFWMENTRDRQISTGSVMPFLSDDEVDRFIGAFQRTTNSFYPIVTQRALDEVRDQYHLREMDFSTKTCLTLLVMALGCAAEAITTTYQESPPDKRRLKHLQSLGRIFFDAAICRLHAAYSTIGMESTQCLALTALYYAYLQRPIQAWAMLSSTATACRVIEAYNSPSPEDTECVRRIFWMCYILESDYLAELPALPHFGIAEIESSVPLPGSFISHGDTAQNEFVSLYFIGCISMRRLLNRCHDLLFGTKASSTPNQQGLAAVVKELDQQLEDWKRLLPKSLDFTIDTEPASSQFAGFLRQRYLTCRALIYRTYLMEAIQQSSTDEPLNRLTMTGARWCLEASLLHIMNLRPYDQTVLVDVWICSLSMAGTMMVLLAAASILPLRYCLDDRVYAVGAHLEVLLGACLVIHGESVSPSVSQALRWMEIIDRILQRNSGIGGESLSPLCSTT